MYDAKPIAGKKKFMCSFPYPYMNGFMHIGHGFTLTKAEFAARYHHLKGENVLFPMGFHCTGMPIQSAANKLKRELTNYGIPPVFPEVEVKAVEKQQIVPENKAKGKKTKLAAKTGNVKHQYDIMKMMVDENEIPAFQEPEHWLNFFPPHAQRDLTDLGMHIDWRRSFITTDKNPYYDAFIRWQLNTLKKNNRVSRGKRPNVYSPMDQQICADHDRSSGEGVNAQEYTIVKLKVMEPLPEKLSTLQGKNVYLAPATLRPETMYGQTNCFVLPDGDYGAYLINDDNVFIISKRSALNLAHQDCSRTWGKVECLLELKGTDLLGLPLKAPNASFDVVYTLPLLTISMGKGTGVVTSVPSDSPDDYAALRDLKQKPALREKYGITEEMVLPFDPVPIVSIPGYGDLSAQAVCDELKIKSQNDKDKLAKAKELVYLKGFYEGVLLVGSQKGSKVCDAKTVIRQELIDSGDAIPYWEPESLVMSRSGDECIVAHLDQWYLTYGAEDWKNFVIKYINTEGAFTAYNPVAMTEYNATLKWLKEWAPCRQFGLGTKLPWDTQFVVESLSDSTIYMAYYTIAHHLQGNIEGSIVGPSNIEASSLTDEVFDFIFLKGTQVPDGCKISKESLQTLQDEFEYWYPLDLRVSGKDLIRNHLTMCLYNHADIWNKDESKMPKSFYTNGHVMVNAEKMSKAKGNFLSVRHCLTEWGADASRFACADAGDSMEDSNFCPDTANMGILRMTTEDEWIKSMLESGSKLRSGEFNFNDNVFQAQMHQLIQSTADSYENMRFREGLRACFFDYLIARDTYREICLQRNIAMHEALIFEFIESMYTIFSPICPHFCDYVLRLIGKDGGITTALWPESQEVNVKVLRAGDFLNKSTKSFRDAIIKAKTAKKGKKGSAPVPGFTPVRATVYVCDEFKAWHLQVLKYLQTTFDAQTKSFPSDFMKQLKGHVASSAELKPFTKQVMQLASFVKVEAENRGVEALELRYAINFKLFCLHGLACHSIRRKYWWTIWTI